MAQVNIKPNRIKFIKALEDSIKRLTDERKAYDAELKQYKKDLEVWRKTADLSPENIKEMSIGIDFRLDEPTKVVTVTLKKVPTGAPKKPTEPKMGMFEQREAVAEMQSIIAMLKLTDEEVVSASVANKVARYL